MFDRGLVYVVVVILSNITVLGLTEEWFMFCLLYCLPLQYKVLQRSSSCCCCYIVYHYCSRFDRGVVHVVVVILSTITVYFYRGEVHVLFVILSKIAVYGYTEEWVILLLLYCLPLLLKAWQSSGSCCGWLYCLPLLFMVWQRSGSCCCYIVYHYNFRFDRGVVHVVAAILSNITV
jgi:hypothetical protein